MKLSSMVNPSDEFLWRVVKIHVSVLGLVLFNWLFREITGFSLHHYIIVMLKLIIYVTGILLFFLCVKKRRYLSLYFSWYIVTPTIVLLFYLFGGIFFAILSSFALYPIYPLDTRHRDRGISLYENFGGFMGRCCPYLITTRQLMIFEREIGIVNLSDLPGDHAALPPESKLEIVGDSLQVTNTQIQYLHIAR